MASGSRDRTDALQWKLLLLVLAAIGAGLGGWLHSAREEAAARERERLQTQARVIEVNLVRQIETIWRGLQGLRAELLRSRPADGNTRLKGLAEAMPGTHSLFVLDDAGTVILANPPELVGANFAQAPHFTTARQHANPALLHIAPPETSPFGAWTMAITIASVDREGRFAGTIGAMVEPELFRPLLASVSYASDFRAALVHGDGTLFTTQPPLNGPRGENLAHPGTLFAQHLASGRTDSVHEGRAAHTGEQRMVAFQNTRTLATHADTPLVIVTSRARGAVHAAWWQTAQTTLLLFALLVAGNVLGLARYQRRTRKLREEARLARAESERLAQRNRLLLEAAGEGIFGVDAGERCIFINPAALAMLGYDAVDVPVGTDLHALIHYRRSDGSPYPPSECPIAATLGDGAERRVEDVFTHRDGHPVAVQLTVTAIRENEHIAGAEVIFHDIGQRKEMERELIRLATTDMLTGIANRRHFMAQLDGELERLRRFEQPAALLMLDLDHFKQINDTRGHAAGDRALCHFVAVVRRALRRTDAFGRLGGEEFGILLPGSGPEGALEFAERLREEIAASPVEDGQGGIPISASIGVAVFDPADPTPDRILARADAALYRAKAGGRNRVEVAD